MVGRRILIVRHAERVDFTFTDEWIRTCFKNNGKILTHFSVTRPQNDIIDMYHLRTTELSH